MAGSAALSIDRMAIDARRAEREPVVDPPPERDRSADEQATILRAR